MTPPGGNQGGDANTRQNVGMWGTFLLDVYRRQDAGDVRDALEQVLGPDSGSGWATGGVYVFWNPDTRAPLYVGIAGDLPERFAQHNGLRAFPATGCKREQIEEYFGNNQRIGISLILQSKMQDDGVLEEFADWTLEELVGFSDATRNVEFAEGNLIRAHAERYGDRPPWNKNKASKEGDGAPTLKRGSGFEATLFETATGSPPQPHHFDVLTDVVGKSLSPLVARNTIREVSTYWNEVTEDIMHAVRMLMLGKRMTYDEAARVHKAAEQGEYLQWIEEEGYLGRKPSIFR